MLLDPNTSFKQSEIPISSSVHVAVDEFTEEAFYPQIAFAREELI